MNIYVSQGHEKGIGLEVFFKSCLFLNNKNLQQLTLVAYKLSVLETLKNLKLPFSLSEKSISFAHINIPTIWLKSSNDTQSFASLNFSMKLAEKGGVLFTLPTSKDQLHGFAGHTDYFRKHYQNSNLGMFFSGPQHQLLLITDHVAISGLSDAITTKKIADTITTAYKSLLAWKFNLDSFLISGIDPHLGEKGIIGTEDKKVFRALELLKKNKIPVSGPYPADSMIFNIKSKSQILVYMYHDQGLGVFKAKEGLIGSNITLGLPYPRLSPDHGTSFNLYSKNEADYRGCLFSLRQALEISESINHG